MQSHTAHKPSLEEEVNEAISHISTPYHSQLPPLPQTAHSLSSDQKAKEDINKHEKQDEDHSDYENDFEEVE